MAILLKANATSHEVQPKDKKFSLAELQGFVGGYIQIIEITEEEWMVMNEEGKLKGMPINLAACARTMGIINLSDEIVGDVLIANRTEIE